MTIFNFFLSDFEGQDNSKCQSIEVLKLVGRGGGARQTERQGLGISLDGYTPHVQYMYNT